MLLHWEIRKIAHPATYAGILVLWGLGVLIGVYLWHNPSLIYLREFGFPFHGLYLPAITLYPLAMIGPILAVLVAGESLAGERARGTLRMALTRPVTRVRIYLVKINLVIVYALFIVFSTLGLTAVLGKVLLGGESFYLPESWDNLQAGFFSLSSKEVGIRLALSGLSIVWYILALAAISFFFSSFQKRALAGPIFTLIFSASFSVLESLDVFQSAHPYFITHHSLYWQTFFSRSIDWSAFFFSFWVIGIYIVISFVLGGIIFCRRDELD